MTTDDPNECVPFTPETYLSTDAVLTKPQKLIVWTDFHDKKYKVFANVQKNLKQAFRNKYLPFLVHKRLRKNDVFKYQ